MKDTTKSLTDTHTSAHVRKPPRFYEKLSHSIQLLQKAEKTALRYSNSGFYLAFSGGKDSQSLYHVAVLAGVKFTPHYSLTTLDPPELVKFIREFYPDVIIDRPDFTFSQLCVHKKALPTRVMRFCCSVLKETKGAGTVTLTGVRRAESYQRSKRNEAEIVANSPNNRFSGNFEQLDQFTRTKEIEGVQCVRGQDKIVINPIIEWTDADVWYFLNTVVKVKHCSLYDKGWKRIGCLFCPMASQKEITNEVMLYPKYKDIIIRTIHRIRLEGHLNDYVDLTDEEVFQWWVSKKSLKEWYADNKLQYSLFNDI